MIRSCIQKLTAYTPGEQPKVKGLIKLNTNENPYPPSPKVLKAIMKGVGASLKRYPDPVSLRFREKIGTVYGFDVDQVLAGNGSDDVLTMALRAFVGENHWVQFPHPTYSLYPVLTQMQNGQIKKIHFDSKYQLELASFDSKANLTLIANPNAPSGTRIPIDFLKKLAKKLKGVLLIDEAYADFSSENALSLARTLPNVLVSRSFSKSFSLAGMRLGFAVGNQKLIEAMSKVKDSYNLDALAQLAGHAALSDMSWHCRTVKQVVLTREAVFKELTLRGWFVYPSHTNFLFAQPVLGTAKEWFLKLRSHKILVRWFSSPETSAFLRITIGTPSEMKTFMKIVDRLSQI